MTTKQKTMLRSVVLHDLDKDGVEPPYHALRLEQVAGTIWVEVVSYDENNTTTLLQTVHRFRFDADVLRNVLALMQNDDARGPGV